MNRNFPRTLTHSGSNRVWLRALALLTLFGAATYCSATTFWHFMGAEEGRIYAVTADDDNWWYSGALRFYWYKEDGGITWLPDAGTGLPGNGSEIYDGSLSDQAEHIFYNGNGEIYTVRRGNNPENTTSGLPPVANPNYRRDGTLSLLRDLSRNGVRNWENGGVEKAVGPPGVNWADYLWLVGGDEGRIYAVDCNGDLLFYQHLTHDQNLSPADHIWAHAGIGQRIGTGWNEFRQVFSGGHGVIYAIDHAGTLFYYRDLARDGTINWYNGGTRVQIGPGWDRFQQVFSTGNDTIYGVDKNGQMTFYKITISETTATCVDCDKPTRPGVEPLVPAGPDALEPLKPLLKTGIYCWPLSAAPGEVIEFKISGPTTSVEIYRHWSTSAVVEAEPMGSHSVVSDFQPIHHVPARHGCGWSTTLALAIPEDWESGIYSARCRFTGGDGPVEQDIAFVVKPRPERRSGLALIANVNTWLAYNGQWGNNKYNSRAHCSFLRPNPGASPSSTGLKHLARGELWILGWLKQNGIVPDVYTDIDFHRGLVAPNTHCLILGTHPEYWSSGMYDRLESFLNQGGSLINLAGNAIFERAEYSCDETGMTFLNGIEANNRDYSLFRDARSPRPSERTLLGVATEACDATGAAYQIIEPVRGPLETLEDWERRQQRFRFVRGLSGSVGESGYNTGDGDFNPLGMAAGWEVDSSTGPGSSGFILGNCAVGCFGGVVPPSSTPAGLVVLARATSPLLNPTGGCHPSAHAIAEMTYYDHPGGGFVFSVGSITFGGSLVKDPGLQMIVGRALSECCLELQCPGDMMLPPDGPTGAIAHFEATSHCLSPGVAIDCTPLSGTLFPLGPTPVRCVARLGSNSNECSFTVTVLTNASDCLQLECTNHVRLPCMKAENLPFPSSQFVRATNLCNSTDLVLLCDPPDISMLDPGTHTVRCTASNSSGVSKTCEFTVEIFIPFPTLSIRRGKGPLEIVIGWARSCGELEVEETPNLDPQGIWLRSTLPVESSGDFFEMAIPIEKEAKFYRLRDPRPL